MQLESTFKPAAASRLFGKNLFSWKSSSEMEFVFKVVVSASARGGRANMRALDLYTNARSCHQMIYSSSWNIIFYNLSPATVFVHREEISWLSARLMPIRPSVDNHCSQAEQRRGEVIIYYCNNQFFHPSLIISGPRRGPLFPGSKHTKSKPALPLRCERR